eukprot:TRINITY_DN2180_c0_g1_i1.p1 TRINITY_DN2180_c0_g1~~TRINITY_DN2180_c0_g1_i1.p1  ORF type:complete len:821 (-),score=296.35 TRINITY_DN2180_c0_g1_i1:81-2198(-)
MLATGVDEMSWDDMDNDSFKWPTVARAAEYRRKCLDLIVKLINDKFESPVAWDSPMWAIVMGIEHDHIHLETSSVLIRQLPISVVRKPETWNYAPANITSPPPQNSLVQIPQGTSSIGKRRPYPTFGWDNEYGSKQVTLPAFKASKYLITNFEFLSFVLEDGYSKEEHWIDSRGNDEGWRWVQYRNAKHPSFWVGSGKACDCGRPDHPYQKDCVRENSATSDTVQEGHQFKLRAMFSIIDMPWDWPVEVNYHEAKAYCSWKSKKDGISYTLPTEAQFHQYRTDVVALTGQEESLDSPPELEPENWKKFMDNHNIGLKYCSSSPVSMHPPSQSGLHDTFGNVWEWVEDQFHALPGFEIHPLYDDFSTPCFDSFHTMILGGSWVSAGDLASPYARFHFRRHFFQHLGFRLVEEDKESRKSAENIEKKKRHMDQLLLRQYGDLSSFENPLSLQVGESYIEAKKNEYWDKLSKLNSNVGENLWKTVVEMVAQHSQPTSGKVYAADLNCEVGRSSYELAKTFDGVSAFSLDEETFRLSMILKRHGKREYEKTIEGEIILKGLAQLPYTLDRSRACFSESSDAKVIEDFQALAKKHREQQGKEFDAVVAIDLLTKLRNPRKLTDILPQVVRKGGVVAISSAFDWNKECIPKPNWIGGYYLNGEEHDSAKVLKQTLSKEFDCVGEKEVVSILPVSARSSAVSIQTVLIFRKK